MKNAWLHTVKAGLVDDADAVKSFARIQPVGTRLRHRVVGDFMKDGGKQ